jgi:CheY-like chemotaxis protein
VRAQHFTFHSPHQQRPPPRPSNPQPEAPYTMHSSTSIEIRPILLAEDSARDVELTLSALDTHNLANRVTVVNDGAEVMDFLLCKGPYQTRAAIIPAVILLDLKMPKMDGLEVLRRIRSIESLKAIPVVMLTSSREEADIAQSYQLGVNAYVVKPVNFTDFLAAVKELGLFWALLNEPPPPSSPTVR